MNNNKPSTTWQDVKTSVTYKDIESLAQNDQLRIIVQYLGHYFCGGNDIKEEEDPIGSVNMYKDANGKIHIDFETSGPVKN